MVAPGAGLCGVTLFRSKNKWRPKQKRKKRKKKEKGLRRKISGCEFLVQMRLDTKQNEKTTSLPQISGVVVSHHNMVSPQMVSSQNGVTLATTLTLKNTCLKLCSTELQLITWVSPFNHMNNVQGKQRSVSTYTRANRAAQTSSNTDCKTVCKLI